MQQKNLNIRLAQHIGRADLLGSLATDPSQRDFQLRAGLRFKYAQILSLKAESDRWVAQGIFRLQGAQAKARRGHMRALARLFPGALKELGLLPYSELLRRHRILEWATLHPYKRLPDWAAQVLAMHRHLRARLGGRRFGVGQVLDDSLPHKIGLHAMWVEIGASFGVSPEDAHATVFGCGFKK